MQISDPNKLLKERSPKVEAKSDYPAPKKAISIFRLEAVVDLVLQHPEYNAPEIAQAFNRSINWAYQITSSSAFKQKLAERKEALIDPFISRTITDRFEALSNRALDILQERIEDDECDNATILKALDIAAKGLGYGGNNKLSSTNIQQNFVVALPQQAQTEEQWAKGRGNVVEADRNITHNMEE